MRVTLQALSCFTYAMTLGWIDRAHDVADIRAGRERLDMQSTEQKRTEGDARNAAWRKLSDTEKLADLDRRLGAGLGATRQRKLIAARMAKQVKA